MYIEHLERDHQIYTVLSCLWVRSNTNSGNNDTINLIGHNSRNEYQITTINIFRSMKRKEKASLSSSS